MNQTINKRKITLIVVIVLIIAALITGVLFSVKAVRTNQKIASIGAVTKDTEELDVPIYKKVMSSEKEIHIDFKDKKLISEGKYGFRKKITLEKRSAVSLAISGESQDQCKDVRVGLFRDPELTDPIEEGTYIDWGDESYEEAELGKEREIGEGEDGQIFVDAGTYYVGLYTTNPFDAFTVEYQGWYGEMRADHMLKEGSDNGILFFSEGSRQDFFFKIKAKKSGKIKVVFNIRNGGAVKLCDKNKKVVSDGNAKYVDGYLDEAYFTLEKSKTYYIKLYKVGLTGSAPMYPNSIRYKYMKKAN